MIARPARQKEGKALNPLTVVRETDDFRIAQEIPKQWGSVDAGGPSIQFRQRIEGLEADPVDVPGVAAVTEDAGPTVDRGDVHESFLEVDRPTQIGGVESHDLVPHATSPGEAVVHHEGAIAPAAHGFVDQNQPDPADLGADRGDAGGGDHAAVEAAGVDAVRAEIQDALP